MTQWTGVWIVRGRQVVLSGGGRNGGKLDLRGRSGRWIKLVEMSLRRVGLEQERQRGKDDHRQAGRQRQGTSVPDHCPRMHFAVS